MFHEQYPEHNLQTSPSPTLPQKANDTLSWSVEHTYNNIIDSNNHSATISILDRFVMQSPKILVSKSALEKIINTTGW